MTLSTSTLVKAYPAYPEGIKSQVKLLLPPILGTIVEYYDYTLYGFCASVLAQQFFPQDNAAIALLKTFGIFVAGSLSKPLGALLFGYMGDRYGRSFALKISIIGIAIPTLFIGLMPSYETLGWFSPFFLLICRILQGIFTSGESDGVRIFVYETMGKQYACFANSLCYFACMIGIYLASLAASVVLSEGSPAWFWRVPFIVSGALGLIVFWSRHYMSETPDFLQYSGVSKGKLIAPLKGVIFKNIRFILITVLWCGAVGGGYHFYLVFFGHYLSLLGIMESNVLLMISQGVLVYSLCIPMAGFIADKVGAIRIIKFSLWVLLGCALLNGIMISHRMMPTIVLLLTAGVLAFCHAPVFALLLEKFKVEERYRCASLGHAIGSLLFSGSAPLIGLWIWQTTGIAIAPLCYFIFLIGLGYLAVMLLEKKLV